MKKNVQRYSQILSANLFPVVGVGASAGGLEAFKQLVRAIPASSGVAYILIQHLAPQRESLLPEILQKLTTLPVVEITDNIEVHPDHVYIIPSNKILIANGETLLLDPRVESEKTNIIDMFFTSLAEIHQEHAIGVVLSGTGTDGTVGLKTIKDQGGLTIVQDKATASFYGMPQSAINAEVVDFVLAPEQIPSQIEELITSEQISPVDVTQVEDVNEKDSFRQILALIQAKHGVDFTYYKQTTIRRRILRRKGMVKKDTLKEYHSYLSENKAEVDALFRDLLIPVTAFFRDENVFNLLCEKVLPGFFDNETLSEPVRIWVAGCSTGEEAYSIAICVYEFLSEHPSMRKVQIFATDLSELSIAKARSGKYLKKDMAGVSEERITKFFDKVNSSYHVKKVIREMCVFAPHNFLKDPPFARLDLISCRNVLIYMEPYLQKRAISTFHFALLNTGFLLFGLSESTSQTLYQFKIISQHEKLFAKKKHAGAFMPVTSSFSERVLKREDDRIKDESGKDDFQKAADSLLLSKFAAVGVIVNEQLDILQFRGSTSAYLEAPPGKASHNILKMAKEGLSFDLSLGFRKAKSSNKPYKKEGIRLHDTLSVNIEIFPLLNTIELYFLVLFNTHIQADPLVLQETRKRHSKQNQSPDAQSERIEQLEKELWQLREDIRILMDDQEAANGELQSANAELFSSSEELQALNDELEATKEEIQSSNEELTILNQELIERNEQLIDYRKYSEAIVTTIHEPLIIITKDALVRTANRAYYEKFSTSPEQTEDKQFFKVLNGIWNLPELRANLDKMLANQQYFEEIEISIWPESPRETTLVTNIRHIINEQSNEQLILIAMYDITERKALARKSEEFSRQLETEITARTRDLQEANLNLQQTNENLQQFASIASHDLQEPLRKIKTFIAILNKNFAQVLPEGGKEVVRKMGVSIDRMSLLIREVLRYSKIADTAKDFQPTDLDLIIRDVIDDLELIISDKQAIIVYPRPLPQIDAIPLLINQMFSNLLTNALKFNKAGTNSSVHISYDFIREQDDGNQEINNEQLEIRITDNGIGFNQQFAVQIFQIFERLHSSDDYEGTGIGLALCKKIVENHHGSIKAISVESEGATFIIVLPVHQPT